jgi:hypothetical protein
MYNSPITDFSVKSYCPSHLDFNACRGIVFVGNQELVFGFDQERYLAFVEGLRKRNMRTTAFLTPGEKIFIIIMKG